MRNRQLCPIGLKFGTLVEFDIRSNFQKETWPLNPKTARLGFAKGINFDPIKRRKWARGLKMGANDLLRGLETSNKGTILTPVS